MEFWGVEVKSGQPLEVNPGEGKLIHLSQACLGEIKSNKPSESVYLHVTIAEKKSVLATLYPERLPQQLFDLVFDQNFQLSHNWKNGSVYFYGYKVDQPTDEDEYPFNNHISEDMDSEEEEEALRLPVIYGQHEDNIVNKKDGKQKVKIVDPKKDKKADSDDSNSDNSDDSMSDDSDDSDEDNEDSSDSDDDSDEDEETPQKQQSEKKKHNESAIKTPSSNKKAKMSTPQKTEDSKKPHVDTPHPSKKPANKSNQKSPASTSDGAHSCKSCNRNFKSDGALKSHNQAKHASK
ncbi:histone deacetylase HDT1-like [Rutidosis leptorrhynchoides]|uniref:histone deacetylase HDT1-like n=1 Tax=Rutidosis leptorrhynchoides TaxID=125765 RepID=UPI003A99BA46